MNEKSKSFVVSGKILLFLFLLFGSTGYASSQPVRVLIYSGFNNHNWSKTTPVIEKILTDASMSVDVINKPNDVTAQQLSKYDVILSNWNNFKDKKLVWSDETRQAFLDFISEGGGHVMIHAGGSSFYDWPEYHRIVASWGKATNHGRIHEFPVSIETPDHAICNGLKPFKTTDELWRNSKFPEGSKVLLTAFSSKESGGNDTNEPILAVSQYGSGRCVNFMLGHDAETMLNPGFKEVLIRSVLWAGGGRQNSGFKWQEADKSVSLVNNGKVVWQFNWGKETSKPFFHPLSLLDGTVLTEDRPKDHPWHHGLWFSWKYLNGVNFWEENKAGKSQGTTDWSNVKVAANKDSSAKITMDLAYHHKDQKPILAEKRTMEISAPDKNGVYYIDWTSKFTACSDEDVKIDRTPLPGEEGGKSWGGYAGLSMRFNGKGDEWNVVTEKGPVELKDGRFRGKAMSMDFSGVFDGKSAGIAMLDHPDNINHPTPWYPIKDKHMRFFNPAVVCFKPFKLASGESFTLKYRVFVHPDKWDADKLKSEIKKFEKAPVKN